MRRYKYYNEKDEYLGYDPRQPGFLTNFLKSERHIYEKAIAEHWEKFPYDAIEFVIVEEAYTGPKYNFQLLPEDNALHVKGCGYDTGNFWKIFKEVKGTFKKDQDLIKSGKLKYAQSFYDN